MGEHDEFKLDWGDFILADGGTGRGRGRGGRTSFDGRAPPMGRGRGRYAEFLWMNGTRHGGIIMSPNINQVNWELGRKQKIQRRSQGAGSA